MSQCAENYFQIFSEYLLYVKPHHKLFCKGFLLRLSSGLTCSSKE